jgi:hypothetical protein
MPRTTRRKAIRQEKLTQEAYVEPNSKKITRPGAPHNTTQYLSKNLLFRVNSIHEDDITEIRGTMEGLFVCSEEDTDDCDA